MRRFPRNYRGSSRLRARILLVLLYILSGSVLCSVNTGCAGQPAGGLDYLKLDQDLEGTQLNSEFSFLRDDSVSLGKKPLDFKLIGANPRSVFVRAGERKLAWLPRQSNKLKSGITRDVVWVRLRVKNTRAENVEWLLQQEYPLIDDIRFYAPDKSGSYSAPVQTGDGYEFEQRPFIHHTFVFPIVSFANTEAVYYLRYVTSSSMNIRLRAWSEKSFAAHKAAENPILFMFYGSLVVLFIYNIFVWASIREMNYLLYIGFILAIGVFSTTWNGVAYQYLWPREIWWQNHGLPFILALAVSGFQHFTRYFLELWKLNPRLDRISQVLGHTISMLGVFALFNYSIGLKMIAAGLVGMIIIGFYVIYRYAIIERMRQAIFLGVAMFALLTGATISAVSFFGLLPMNNFTLNAANAGVAALVILLSFGLADRINTLKRDLELLNAGLEDRVKERTNELNNSLKHIKALNEQQEGDYYLTSLLLKPIRGGLYKSDTVDIQIYERQKKRFNFRGREVEIGGDISSANDVILRGEKYSLFLNGDAMGKSIQGAGGALVLGTVFNALVARSRARKEAMRKSPEIWLKECFQELQNVFVSFNGSMLVSAIIGLLHEESGFLCYLNAEHPPIVLYRDGKADFVDDSYMLKIGIEGLDKGVRIHTCQLKPGDVLYVGSDGKDDLLIGQDEQGNRLINSEETEFLRRVEEGDGMMVKVIEGTRQKGEITDDFSLLRIAYKEDAARLSDGEEGHISEHFETGQELLKLGKPDEALLALRKAESVNGENAKVLYQMGLAHLKLKDYQAAGDYLTRSVELDPSNTRALYQSSYALKLSRRFVESVDYGERCKLRDPGMLDNIVNLADSHRKVGNLERAQKLVRDVLAEDPQNAGALALQERMGATPVGEQ